MICPRCNGKSFCKDRDGAVCMNCGHTVPIEEVKKASK